MADIDEELEVAIRGLTQAQMVALAQTYSKEDIERFFHQIKENIAIQLKTRVQSKIALTFTGGYSTGRLFDSIYYRIEGNSIVVKSTQNYFTILNRGYDSFDMKESLMESGRPIPIRLPGGRIIFRYAGEVEGKRRMNEIMGPIRNRKFMTKKGAIRKYYSTKNWIHPGYQGRHIYEQVQREMAPWIKEYVREQIITLIRTLPPPQPYATTPGGHTYYSKRDSRGRFV